MPAVSKTQRKLMGWAHACKTGKVKNCPPNIQKVAKTMSQKDLKKFAKTKEKTLPSSVKETSYRPTFKEFVSLLEDAGIEKDERFLDLPKRQQIALKKQLQGKSNDEVDEMLQRAWERVNGSKGISMSRDDSSKDDDTDDEQDN
jgi:hypothetical protein